MSCQAYSTETGKGVDIEPAVTQTTSVHQRERRLHAVRIEMWGAVKLGRVLRTPTNTNVTCIAGSEITVQHVQ